MDMACLLEDGELDRMVLHDEHGEHPSMQFEPSRGECRDVSERRATMTCSVCGATVKFGFDADGEPTITVDGFADVPKYCPNCGRKVVS